MLSIDAVVALGSCPSSDMAADLLRATTIRFYDWIPIEYCNRTGFLVDPLPAFNPTSF